MDGQFKEQTEYVDDTQKKPRKNTFGNSKISNSLIRKRIGRAIWLQINTVVCFTKQMRTTDKQLFEIQNRVRYGLATAEDHAILSKRVVKPRNDLQSLSNAPWNEAPIIVFRNSLRTDINIKAVVLKSIEQNAKLIVCVAKDIFPKTSTDNTDLIRYALNLDDNKTEHLPGFLPLAAGSILFCLSILESILTVNL